MADYPWVSLPPKTGLYDPAYEKDSCGVALVANIQGARSHQIIKDALTALERMEHRGACGCEENTGDGAGILTALPDKFLRRVAREIFHESLPDPGEFGVGLVFLPREPREREYCKQAFAKIVAEEGQRLLGWRKAPTSAEAADVGPTARATEPAIEQVFIAAGPGLRGDALEHKLFLIRKRASHLLRGDPRLRQAKLFYICSLSTKVLIHKGMLTSYQVAKYFADLREPDFESHLAMVHSRFSTNTFPSWDRAQPFRFMCHNGEINTLRGNVNWMAARQGVASSPHFGADIQKLFPIAEPDTSDSGNFDNVLEFLLMGGRTLQEAVMMMIPEAWQQHASMPPEKRAFYEYHSCVMEPWDGPASIVFTDGQYVGAVLDRNGLRPSRYYLTHDDRVLMSSEVGVFDVAPENVKLKGRLQPGRMFLVDFERGRLIPDEELKRDFAARRPYGDWLRRQRISLDELPAPANVAPRRDSDALLARMQAFGYTLETMQFMLIPLVADATEPLGSMGCDTALACLSDQPRLLYDYFKQLFAQVTNPPIDSIREEIIMSLECYIGPEQNLLDTTEEHCRRLRVPQPILANQELAALKALDHRGWKSRVIDITFPAAEGERGMLAALDRACGEAEEAIDAGFSLVILSDRGVDPERAPLSSLLACGAVHHHLVRRAKRTRIGIVLETGEAREVHHHCLLVGYGADAINPYLAFEALWQARDDGLLDAAKFDDEHVVEYYRKAVAKGLRKVMGKMGISTLQSYKGAQIFEALGLRDEVIERCFVGTASRVQGCGFNVLAEETLRRHRLGFPLRPEDREPALPNPGEYHWRADGENHMWDPPAIAELQIAARSSDSNVARQAYERYAEHMNRQSQAKGTLRGLMKFKENFNGGAIPLDEVEKADKIVKRFCTGAMSFGSISKEAHETLAIAMNAIGGKSNTGEGGEDPERYEPLPDGSPNPRRSAIKQVASGRFGVTIGYLTNADELQIKIAQGAKPGEGGELPGRKVDEVIARVRHSTPGVGLISPPPHHDIYSIEDLAQLIFDLKNANPDARVSVKLVSEVGVGTIAAGVAKAHADHILISGDTGGTGASPLTSIKHAGLPWELGIAETHQTLVLNDLRSRVVLQTDGGIRTGRDVVIAAMLGAEEIGFSTAPLIALGCVMMRKCHLNTCPVGIATQDPELRQKFTGLPEHVINYLFMVAEEARRIMAHLGFKTFNDMVGRVDALDPSEAVRHWKRDGIDLSTILAPARKPRPEAKVYNTDKQNHGLDRALDWRLIELAHDALATGRRVFEKLSIGNVNRTVGAMLSNALTKKHGEKGLADDTIHFKFTGSAGQSFGAFLAPGVTLELEGDANDYVGKGLSGGRLVLYPHANSGFAAEDNVLAGNVVLYGAIRGEAFFRGRAAERFCVRNSGAEAVIEGVGDHGCEYMTGGRVVVLGPTGRNFAAGMSGGVAYVWDPHERFAANCNTDSVLLEPVDDPAEADDLRRLIERHRQHTDSVVAGRVLAEWPARLAEFRKVMPIDYKRVLEQRKAAQRVSVNGHVSDGAAPAGRARHGDAAQAGR